MVITINYVIAVSVGGGVCVHSDHWTGCWTVYRSDI